MERSNQTCRKNKRSKVKPRSKKVSLTSKLSQSSRYDLKNVRGDGCGQSRAQQQYSNSQDHYQEAVAQDVTIENTKEKSGSTAPSPKDRTWTPSLKSSMRKPSQTRLRNMRPHRDCAGQVERSQVRTHSGKTKSTWVAVTGSPTSTRRAEQLQSKVESGMLSCWRKHHVNFGETSEATISTPKRRRTKQKQCQRNSEDDWSR